MPGGHPSVPQEAQTGMLLGSERRRHNERPCGGVYCRSSLCPVARRLSGCLYPSAASRSRSAFRLATSPGSTFPPP